MVILRVLMNINVQFKPQSIFSIQYPQVGGCLHHWMWSLHPQILRCHLNPVSCSMMMSGSSHMDMGMGVVHVVRHGHEYIKFCQGFLPYPNVHHQGGTVWKSSSMSSSSVSMVTYVCRMHLEGKCWKVSVWCCTGSALCGDGVSSIGVSSSSSSEELKVRHLCTSLQGNFLIPLLCGMTESWIKWCMFSTGDVVNLWDSSKWLRLC